MIAGRLATPRHRAQPGLYLRASIWCDAVRASSLRSDTSRLACGPHRHPWHGRPGHLGSHAERLDLERIAITTWQLIQSQIKYGLRDISLDIISILLLMIVHMVCCLVSPRGLVDVGQGAPPQWSISQPAGRSKVGTF